jgi:hypothetical protein
MEHALVPANRRSPLEVLRMDASRFDSWTRSLVVRFSRRQAVQNVAVAGALGVTAAVGPGGVSEGEAAKRECRRGRKPCRNKCCKKGEICAKGQCVAGRGDCPAGANECLVGGNNLVCNNDGTDTCFCRQTFDDKTRCGQNPIGGFDCGECTTNADCAALFPDVPGAFCAKDGPSGACGCAAQQGFCQIPCDNLI